MAKEYLDLDGTKQVYNDLRSRIDFIRETEGEIIRVDDSEDAPIIGMTIRGKTAQFHTAGNQLCNMPDHSPGEYKGITWSCKNGVIHAKGTAKGYSESHVAGIAYYMPIIKGTYYISEKSYIRMSIETVAQVIFADGTSKIYANEPFSLDGSETECRIFCQILNSTVDLYLYPMVNRGGSPLDWELYTGGKPSPSPEYPQEIITAGASGSIETKVGGKNLCSNVFASYQKPVDYRIYSMPLAKGKTYTFSANQTGATISGIVLGIVSSGSQYSEFKDFKILIYTDGLVREPITITGDNTWGEDAKIVIFAKDEGIFNSIFTNYNIQLEVGSVATPYEPFKPIQTATATTPDGLSSINGVYDEVNYITGKRTRKFGKWVFDGSPDEEWKTGPTAHEDFKFYYINNYGVFGHARNGNIPANIRCTHYNPISGNDSYRTQGITGCALQLAGGRLIINDSRYPNDLEGFKSFLNRNPITVIMELETPIITSISKEEMDIYYNLYFNNPNTTIWNSDGTEMEVTYLAKSDVGEVMNNLIDRVDTSKLGYNIKKESPYNAL